MIGRRLGHYEIVEKLGEGMGSVYRARDTTLGRDVALKLLPEFVAGDGEKIARLERRRGFSLQQPLQDIQRRRRARLPVARVRTLPRPAASDLGQRFRHEPLAGAGHRLGSPIAPFVPTT